MSRKKDVLAAITFLATGFLFFVAQIEGANNALLSQDGDCVVTETLLIGNTSQPEGTPSIKDSRGWDA